MRKKLCLLLLLIGMCFAFASCGGVVKTEKITVTFKQNGQADIVKTVVKGDNLVQVPTPADKTGYSVVWDRTDFTELTDNIIVNAVETANTYTITYAAEGFDIDGTTVELTYDSPCTALDMTLTKENTIFLGWKYDGVTYSQGSIWDVAENVTVVADWLEKGQVLVAFMDTDGTTINKTAYKGGTLTDIPTPKNKIGYIVDTENWYKDKECTTIATFADLQENTTVYAKTTAKTYTVTLNANGGNVSQTTLTVTYGQEYSLVKPTYGTSKVGIWTYNGRELATNGIWDIDEPDGTIELIVKWELWTGEY